jgi:hypothetical protein
MSKERSTPELDVLEAGAGDSDIAFRGKGMNDEGRGGR